MGAGTFPDEKVRKFIETYFVPVRYTSGPDAEQFHRFGVAAEPAFLILDAEGDEVLRKIGYFEPDLFIEKLEKARKKAAHKAVRSIINSK